MKNILYLASQSSSRKKLLTQMEIPFKVFVQSADEQACDWTLPLEQLVRSIALHKMKSLDVSLLDTYRNVWILTADTLGQDSDGQIYGKPADFDDAIKQIKSQRDKWVRVATSFCLERKSYQEDAWKTEKQIIKTVVSEIFFSIPDDEIEAYIHATHALECAGSITIEGFGGQYLKAVKGSYSSVIGLPLYEVRQALRELEFFL